MKLLLLLAFLVAPLYSQTMILGPLSDSSGSLATCQLTIRPVSVGGFSPTIISYTVVAGDLTGFAGGYGTDVARVTRHAQLALFHGKYTTLMACAGDPAGIHTYTWQVPYASSFSILRLIQGLERTLGEITTDLGSTPGTLGDQ